MKGLVRIEMDELPYGPLPCCLYDRQGRLLYSRGLIIGSVGYLRLLVARGLYRRPDLAEGPAVSPPQTSYV